MVLIRSKSKGLGGTILFKIIQGKLTVVIALNNSCFENVHYQNKS